MHCLYFLKIMFIILIHFSCVNCKNMYIYKYNFPLLFAFSLFFTLSFKSLYYPQLPVKHALGVKLQNCQHQKKLLTYYLLPQTDSLLCLGSHLMVSLFSDLTSWISFSLCWFLIHSEFLSMHSKCIVFFRNQSVHEIFNF